MKKENDKSTLLSRWRSREKSSAETTPITKAPGDIPIPLSRGQQRLYFLEQLYPNNPVYNSSEIYSFQGPLDVERLKKSLQLVIEANDILRCSFHLTEGIPIQKVNEDTSPDIRSIDLSQLSTQEKDRRQEEILTEDSLAPFNLEHAPLMRIILLKRSPLEHILFFTMHHIITDKWSMDLFRDQLTEYYKALSREESVKASKGEIQFTDYAYWQQHQEVDPKQLQYWKNKLSGEIPFLQLPTDYPLPVKPSFNGGSYVKELPETLSLQIIALSKSLNVTPYVLLLTAFYVLLHRYSGQEDILIGSPISTRNSRVLEGIIGFFDETIVLRTQFQPNITFAELLTLVQRTTMESFSNKDVPFDLLVKELKPARSPANNPFFRTMFIYHDVPATPSFSQDIALSYTFYNKGVSKFDLTLYIALEKNVLTTELEYAADLFELGTMVRLQDHFRILLEGIIANPQYRIAEIPMLTPAEKEFFLHQRNTASGPYAHYNTIHEIIEEAAAKTPSAPAVVLGGNSLTYAELNTRATDVASAILSRTAGKNEIVGLFMERSAEMIVGLLGILKAGCAYLPLDTGYPASRIRYILEDSGVTLLLTENKSVPALGDVPSQLLIMSQIPASKNRLVGSIAPVGREDMAYVIYTSGSTGKPKGVPITHNNIINSTEGRLGFYQNDPKAFLLMSSISFDSSKAGVFWTLCTGGTLVVSEKEMEQDIDRMGEVIAKNKVTHTLMLPSLYNTIITYCDLAKLQSLRTVIVAGEACTSSVVSNHFEKLPQVSLYNEYGPTEATIWCIAHQIKKEDEDGIIPIGRAVANAEIYLLNAAHELVPKGAVGEIYIGGTGLAGTYLKNPELSSTVYIGHPFRKNGGHKLYKTGDLARYNKDGNLEFMGRADQQIKIRGFRVEIGEIEKIFEQYDAVDKAVVLVDDASGENSFTNDPSPDSAEIMKYMARIQDENQLEVLLRSIKDMKEEDRKYLLQQLQ
ncbi:MAG TPA: amino acid adenylation domain-containing protein [Eudoraea sp.]|nr:amino acid adenylation domain-containing protein [Eudoraea sp.]